MRRALLIWCVLALLALVAFVIALMQGSTPISLSEIWAVAMGTSQDDVARSIMLDLRLPRALAAFACGALLATAGSLIQVLLRNPLADPYVLGVSGGAAVGALSAMLLSLAQIWVQTGAAVGACLSLLVILLLARREFSAALHQEAGARLLLTGVMLAAGWTAVVSLMLNLAPETKLRGMLFWLTGDLNGVEGSAYPYLTLVVVCALAWPKAHALNALIRGEAVAQALGVPVGRLRLRLYLAAALACAAAVITAGTLGFVGLIVPHVLRLVCGNDQRLLLPASALAGGWLLLVADTLARTIIAPAQLPVGVFTTLLGVPVFLFMLARRGR